MKKNAYLENQLLLEVTNGWVDGGISDLGFFFPPPYFFFTEIPRQTYSTK